MFQVRNNNNRRNKVINCQSEKAKACTDQTQARLLILGHAERKKKSKGEGNSRKSIKCGDERWLLCYIIFIKSILNRFRPK